MKMQLERPVRKYRHRPSSQRVLDSLARPLACLLVLWGQGMHCSIWKVSQGQGGLQEASPQWQHAQSPQCLPRRMAREGQGSLKHRTALILLCTVEVGYEQDRPAAGCPAAQSVIFISAKANLAVETYVMPLINTPNSWHSRSAPCQPRCLSHRTTTAISAVLTLRHSDSALGWRLSDLETKTAFWLWRKNKNIPDIPLDH